DRVHTAERLQRRARRRGVAVEVMVRSQAMRGLLPLRAAGDGYDLMAHGGRELDGEMTDPPDPEDRDTAAARRVCRPDGVERGDARAPHRCRLDVSQAVGDPCQGHGRRQEPAGPASGVADAGDAAVGTVHDVTGAAGAAAPAAAAEPADGDAVPDPPPLDPVAELADRPGDLMAGD